MDTANKQPDAGAPLTLKIVRKFDVAPDAVFNAFTKPEAMRVWWTDNTTFDIDLWPGGIWTTKPHKKKIIRTMKNVIILAGIIGMMSAFYTINAQDMDPKITTFLMFEGQAEEAITFYTSLFDDSEIVRITKYGPDGPGGPDAEGSVQNALLTLKGEPYMAIDSYGHNFTFTPAISLFVQCDSEEKLESLYEKLMEGGTAAMPLGEYGFSTKFGWVQDRFGVSWQLNYGQLKFE